MGTERILMLEDNADDAELIHRELRRGNVHFVSRVVDSQKAFTEAIKEFSPTLILSDFKLPDFDAIEALGLAQRHAPETPFIVVTGVLGEEIAVETVQRGATDYVLKDRLFRLVPATRRALQENELRLQRREADEAAKESEARKGAIVQAALDPIITFDHEGRILDFNAAAEKTFGQGRAEIIGKEMASVIVPAAHRQAHRERLARLLSTGDGQGLGKRDEMTALRADGTEFEAELAITRIELAGPPTFIAFIRDISERRLTERHLEARNAVARILAEALSLSAAAAGILEAMCENLGWEVGAMWLVQGELNVLSCLDAWSVPGCEAAEFVQATGVQAFRRNEDLPGKVWFGGEPVWIQNVLADSNFQRGPLAARSGLHAALGFPIRLKNEVIGVIEFFSGQIREPDERLLKMLSALGVQIGQFIARKEAEEALRDAEGKYRSIFENSMEGIFQTTPDGRFLRLNPALARMLGYASPEELMQAVKDLGRQFWAELELGLELKRRLETDGYVKGFETKIGGKDGGKTGETWASINAQAVLSASGAVLYYEGACQDITLRKRAEEQIRLLADAVQSTQELISITDSENRFVFVNHAFLRAYGYSEGEILGRTPSFLYSANNPPELYERIFEQTLAGGWKGELLHCRKDGTEFPISLGTSQIKHNDGGLLRLVGVARDITERKRAEKRSTAVALLGYHLSSAAAPEQAASIILSIASDLFGWDSAYVHLYSREEDKIQPILTIDTVEGKRMPIPAASFEHDLSPLMRLAMKEGARLIDRETGPSISETLVRFGDKQRPSASMMYVPIRSGERVWGLLSIQSYTPRSYSQDDLSLLQSLADHCGDAFQRIKVAEALREAEAKYRSIFENATEGIFQTTPAGRYLSANPALARMLGYANPEELITSVSDIERQTYVVPARRQELKRLLETQGVVAGFEVERYRKDGSRFWISINGHEVRNAQGNVLYYEGTNQDITQRKRAESVLRESEEKFRTLFESAPIGGALHDARGRYVQINAAYQRMLGYTDEELRQSGVKGITHPEDIPEAQKFFEEMSLGKRDRYQREKRYRHKDGHIVWAQSSASAVRNGEGELIYVISMVVDITERKLAEAELRRLPQRIIEAQEAERLRVARDLHDGVNQILASAKMRLRRAEEAIPALNPASKEILRRCGQLLGGALEENRRIAHNLRPSDLDDLGLAAACRNFCREVEARTNLRIKCRVARVEQRWPRELELNLFRIVQEALNNIEKHARAKTVQLQIAAQDDWLVLKIKDNGRGFDPGAAPSGKRKGHGIGLTNMRERASSLGGSCEVKTAPKRGTTITVRVPCSNAH